MLQLALLLAACQHLLGSDEGSAGDATSLGASRFLGIVPRGCLQRAVRLPGLLPPWLLLAPPSGHVCQQECRLLRWQELGVFGWGKRLPRCLLLLLTGLLAAGDVPGLGLLPSLMASPTPPLPAELLHH